MSDPNKAATQAALAARGYEVVPDSLSPGKFTWKQKVWGKNVIKAYAQNFDTAEAAWDDAQRDYEEERHDVEHISGVFNDAVAGLLEYYRALRDPDAVANIKREIQTSYSGATPSYETIRDRIEQMIQNYQVLECKFTPQAWQNDYAIDVDPLGETTWIVATPKGTAIPKDCSHDIDAFRDMGTSPKWIRDWSGPFCVAITNRDDLEEYEAATQRG